MFSTNSRPFTKVVWLGKISVDSRGLSLLTSILDTTLYIVLRHEIGLKSLIFDAPGNLGTKESIVAFAVAGRKLVAKKFFTAAMTSTPMISHDDLKNAEVRPSGPGALFGFSLKNIDLISSLDGIDSMIWLRCEGNE